MTFRFPLAALLKLRVLLEQQERSALERALAAQRAQHDLLQTADEIRACHLDKMREALGTGLSASDLHWSALRIEGILSARVQAEQILADLDSARAKHTARYLAAHKHLEVVEHVRNEMYAQYTQHIQKREQALIDSLHLASLVRDTLKARRERENVSAEPR